MHQQHHRPGAAGGLKLRAGESRGWSCRRRIQGSSIGMYEMRAAITSALLTTLYHGPCIRYIPDNGRATPIVPAIAHAFLFPFANSSDHVHGRQRVLRGEVAGMVVLFPLHSPCQRAAGQGRGRYLLESSQAGP